MPHDPLPRLRPGTVKKLLTARVTPDGWLLARYDRSTRSNQVPGRSPRRRLPVLDRP
jgi:hypothetical protein